MMAIPAPDMVFSQFSQDTQKSRQAPNANTSRVQSLILTDRASQQTFTFDNTVKTEIVVGRADNLANYQPTLDLAPLGAYRLGVSRIHISIVIEQDRVSIIDLKSANGTHVNDTRLIACKPYPLQYGDVIRLGNLILDVRLV